MILYKVNNSNPHGTSNLKLSLLTTNHIGSWYAIIDIEYI